MRKKAIRQIQLKTKSSKIDGEGNVFPDFTNPISIEAELWPASSRLQIELYGQRITSIMNMISLNTVNIEVGDCVVYDDVNYQVITKKKYTEHSYFEIEKL
ncbi:MAG: hypothetical protein RR791_05175 [Lachnospiraceae bacterium]